MDPDIIFGEDSSSFELLQQQFKEHYFDIFLNDLAEKTVVIIPSLTLDKKLLTSLTGSIYYEERLLCMLLLLKMPRTHIIYVTSVPIDNLIIDYYLHLLPGISESHARERLTLLSCQDASVSSLTEKILSRPRLIKRIKDHIRNPQLSHMVCFNETDYEVALAIKIGIPIFGCHPELSYLGSKSGSRVLFRKANIPLPEGFEYLNAATEIIDALTALKIKQPTLQKAVIKLNEGFSGDGNAVFYYENLDATDPFLRTKVGEVLPIQTKIVAEKLSYQLFIEKFINGGGIVEAFIPGRIKESPSVQCRINPFGDPDIISTHDQLLGGESGQVFIGSSFPANPEYATTIAGYAKNIGLELQKLGVLGRFSIDFVSVKEISGWKHFAIEINIRKGGTTHPFIMLQFLTGGYYLADKGAFITLNGESRSYFASDNVVDEKFKGLTPYDLIDIAMCNHILYDSSKQTGVMFHMIGALSQYGKIGMTCIEKTPEVAKALYGTTIGILEASC